mmetsp:Transcript_35702/g.102951  ORF Transcript_35702/g.102951 Transcript_35702/m.102951 type:complete len:205 (+) Transcript_35702:1500-2114(+)
MSPSRFASRPVKTFTIAPGSRAGLNNLEPAFISDIEIRPLWSWSNFWKACVAVSGVSSTRFKKSSSVIARSLAPTQPLRLCSQHHFFLIDDHSIWKFFKSASQSNLSFSCCASSFSLACRMASSVWKKCPNWRVPRNSAFEILWSSSASKPLKVYIASVSSNFSSKPLVPCTNSSKSTSLLPLRSMTSKACSGDLKLVFILFTN